MMQFLMFLTLAAQGSTDGLQIATKSYQAGRGWKDYVVSLEMDIQLSSGQSTKKYLSLKNLENKGGDLNLMVFEKPADVQGTALLTHAHIDRANDQWLYLPEMRRVKRITSDSRNSSFMGSEFTYDDMTFNDLNKYTYKFLKEEKCSLGTCFVVEQTPKDKGSSYSKLVVWYDKATYRIAKTDYYDVKNELLKQMERTNYQKPNSKNWFAGQMKMVNVQTKKSTTLSFSEFKFNASLTDKDFNPDSLGR
jgi:outer membrane lipoprotein-sorting protein